MEAGDINCHIGSTFDSLEGMMGCFSSGVRQQEGKNILGLCQEHNLRVLNSYYRKRRLHIMYKSGGNGSQIDYVLCRRQKELRMKNCKVRTGQACLTLNRLLWLRF